MPDVDRRTRCYACRQYDCYSPTDTWMVKGWQPPAFPSVCPRLQINAWPEADFESSEKTDDAGS